MPSTRYDALDTETLRNLCRARQLKVSERKPGGKHCNWLTRPELIAQLKVSDLSDPKGATAAPPTIITRAARSRPKVSAAKGATGYVYIFTNRSMPGIVKIGKSTDPSFRARGLFTTGVPVPFKVYATLQTAKYDAAESTIHDILSSKRVRDNREFFKTSPEEALKVITAVSKLLDDATVFLSKKARRVEFTHS